MTTQELAFQIVTQHGIQAAHKAFEVLPKKTENPPEGLMATTPTRRACTTPELEALTALVLHQTAVINGHVAKYGELQHDPNTPQVMKLYEEMARRFPNQEEMNDSH